MSVSPLPGLIPSSIKLTLAGYALVDVVVDSGRTPFDRDGKGDARRLWEPGPDREPGPDSRVDWERCRWPSR